MRKTAAALALACALLAAEPAAALGAERLLTGYTVSSWAEWNGTPLGAIFAIAQEPDGYLWLGGSSGLLRFDGVRFSTMEALGLALPGSAVQALHVSPRDGALWIGFAGDGVRIIRNGRVVSATPETALKAGVFSRRGRRGRRLGGHRPRPVPLPDAPGGTQEDIRRNAAKNAGKRFP